jgi:hypothetical protein
MEKRPGSEAPFRVFMFVGILLCLGGAVVGMYVVVVRLPALANTKLEMLFGVLQGVAVSLLFGIVALLIGIASLLINIRRMIRRATDQPAAIPSSGRTPS